MAGKDRGHQVNHPVETVWNVRWTITVTLVIGIFLSSSLTDYILYTYRMWWDATHPVVVTSGTLVTRTETIATIHIKGEKMRDCTFIALHAYTRKNGTLSTANKERFELITEGPSNKPLGKYDAGKWKIWPLGDADTVLMSVMHNCDGRIITTKIAEVPV